MIQEHILGTITDLSETGELTIKAGAPDIDRAVLRQYRTCEIILDDGRKISPQQRRKVYALLGEIDEYVNGIRTAEGMEEQKRLLKLEFMLKRMSKTERQLFSLSDTDVTTAREFITFVIDFIVANDVPTRIPLLEQCEDIGRYVYACLVNKRCCICGKPCDLHHVTGSKIGMGGNREQVHHLGRACLPLCREHHNEAHQDEDGLMRRYHIEPVKIDARICKIYKLKE